MKSFGVYWSLKFHFIEIFCGLDEGDDVARGSPFRVSSAACGNSVSFFFLKSFGRLVLTSHPSPLLCKYFVDAAVATGDAGDGGAGDGGDSKIGSPLRVCSAESAHHCVERAVFSICFWIWI
jgi:hypothetical protein